MTLRLCCCSFNRRVRVSGQSSCTPHTLTAAAAAGRRRRRGLLPARIDKRNDRPLPGSGARTGPARLPWRRTRGRPPRRTCFPCGGTGRPEFEDAGRAEADAGGAHEQPHLAHGRVHGNVPQAAGGRRHGLSVYSEGAEAGNDDAMTTQGAAVRPAHGQGDRAPIPGVLLRPSRPGARREQEPCDSRQHPRAPQAPQRLLSFVRP